MGMGYPWKPRTLVPHKQWGFRSNSWYFKNIFFNLTAITKLCGALTDNIRRYPSCWNTFMFTTNLFKTFLQQDKLKHTCYQNVQQHVNVNLKFPSPWLALSSPCTFLYDTWVFYLVGMLHVSWKHQQYWN